MNYSIEQPWLPFSEVQWQWEVGFHELMLGDQLRMQKYKGAIREVVRQGDVVLDLGTGTGILALWALEAGASKVYGVEVDPAILSLAVDRISAEGYGAKFVPINKVSFDATLREQVDVLISEIMGNLGDNEGFQTILEDAYQRFVKAECRSIPQRVKIYLAPVGAEQAYANVAGKKIATLNAHYDIDKLLADKGLASVFNLYYDTIIPHASCLSSPQLVKEYYDRWQQKSTYGKHLDYVVEKTGVFTGFKGYFVAQLSEHEVLDISGHDIAGRATSDSWKHAYLPIAEPIEVLKGDCISLSYTRSNPTFQSGLDQIYRWQGTVIRDGNVVGQFDQCLDEKAIT